MLIILLIMLLLCLFCSSYICLYFKQCLQYIVILFLIFPYPFLNDLPQSLFYTDKNFEWTLITFRQVFACDWAYCALLNSEECDIFLIFLGWIHRLIILALRTILCYFQSIIHQLHSFIGLFIYLLCSLVHSLILLLSVHLVDHISYKLFTGWYVCSAKSAELCRAHAVHCPRLLPIVF